MEEQAGTDQAEEPKPSSFVAVTQWTVSNIALVSALAVFTFAVLRVLSVSNFLYPTALTIWNVVGAPQILTASLLQSPSVLFVSAAALVAYLWVVWAQQDALSVFRLLIAVPLVLLSFLFLNSSLMWLVVFLLVFGALDATLTRVTAWLLRRLGDTQQSLRCLKARVMAREATIRSNELRSLGIKLEMVSIVETNRALPKEQKVPAIPLVAVKSELEEVDTDIVDSRKQLGLDRAYLAKMEENQQKLIAQAKLSRKGVHLFGAIRLLAVCAIFLGFCIYQPPWWACEKVTVQKNETVIGYVIAADSDWTTIMVEADRSIRYTPTKEVVSRQNCRLGAANDREQPALRYIPKPVAEAVIPNCYP